VVLLAISRAWAADWLYDLRGSGRWARLALLAVASLGLLLATYVGYRAWGVPDIGPPFPAEASRPPETVRPGEDAEAIYQRASLGLRPLIDPARDPGGEPAAISVARVITNGWDPERRAAVAWWEQNQEAIALTRRGASRPVAPTPGAEDLEVAVDASPRFQNMLELARLMALDARRRQDRGDLAGAWDDILVLLRMGRQMTFRVGTIAPAFAPMVQAQADWLGLDWAADPRQTIELLGAALADLHRMPANAPLGEDVKAQYVQMERFLGLSNDELLARFAPTWLGTHGDVRTLRPLPWPERLVFAWGITPSWERQRARRVIRLLTAERLQSVDNEPWKRHAERATGRGPISDLFWPAAAPTRYFPPEELLSYAEGTPLVRLARPLLFDPEARDRELVLRRALVHVLALRRWQLRHDGRLPEALDELLPSELPGLPMDPYSGRSFGYVHSQGQALPPLRPRDVLTRALPPEAPAPTRPGQRILYSIGPDRGDNQASWDLDAVRAASTAASIVGDITFPLPFDASDHPR
ncbi:MAG TPA: hypothetical protein VF590_20685, partial [Isosphaeraceae bacterium]